MEDRRTVKSLGVDIGKNTDHAAMVLSERKEAEQRIRVTDCAQVPLGVSYPKLIHVITRVAEDADVIVVDGNGVGAPVYDFLRVTFPQCWAAIATGGTRSIVNKEHHTIHIPKTRLVEGLVRLVEGDLLKLNPVGDVPTLMMELCDLERTQTEIAVRYEAKTGCHDDMVMALANSILGFGLEGARDDG